MSLLSVTVRKAQFSAEQAGVHQWNSYVTLKLQHVKSTTVTVKGANPSWEQDFLFEVNNLDAGLLIEVWSKGVIWDKAVGYHWLHLRDIHTSNMKGAGQWLPLEEEVVMRDGEVVGTRTPTGHAVLIDARFEVPYANELEGEDSVELQRKLEMFNSMLDQESRAEQARRQHQYYIQSGVSEDSDYTSDVNYPIGQNPNSSASQFLSAANQLKTPQRSLTSSRENSYEQTDEYYRSNGPNHQSRYYPSNNHYQQAPQSQGRKQLPAIPTHQQHAASASSRRGNGGYWEDAREGETEPLYYNSRPQSNYKSYGRYRRRGSWEDEYDQERQEYDDTRQYDEDYDEDAQNYSKPSRPYGKSLKKNPSLERQYTLYDGTGDYGADEEMQDTGYDAYPTANESDPYSASYDHQQSHKNSVYNEYNQHDYSDYQQNVDYGEGYNDEHIESYDAYSHEPSYGPKEAKQGDARDNYTAPAKTGKELPQVPSSIPNQYSRSSQLSSQTASPFASQSTVKEMSIVSNAVQKSDYANKHSYGIEPQDNTYGNEDVSFYDATAYDDQSQSHSNHLASSTGQAATVPTTTSDTYNDQYYDSGPYENQAAYEDWQNYGYYDEAGNFIPYDQSSYYPEETSNLISNEIQPSQTALEKDAYSSSYYEQEQPQPATSLPYDQSTTAATTNVTVHAEPESAYNNEQYDEASYYQSSGVDQQYESYDNYGATETYGSYDQDGYWYDQTQEQHQQQQEGYNEIQQENDENKYPPSTNKNQEPNEGYNYAYQSAENLTATDSSVYHKLDKSESVSRRASFRRQASTRSDYAPSEPASTEANGYVDSNHVSYTKPPVVASTAIPISTSGPPTSTTSAAAVAASKLTSEIKSALPQLSSLTKGKTDLFTSSFSKLGSFVSNAAAKTGMNVPVISQNKDANKDKDAFAPIAAQAPQPEAQPPHQPDVQYSTEQGLGYSFDDSQYQQDEWQGHYDEHGNYYPAEYPSHEQDGYEQHENVEHLEPEPHKKGPVHMDSIESNVSEGARDGEDLEAEYWQKQQERIAKQASLQAQESQDYYQYDSYDNRNANLLRSMDSTDEGDFRQSSIDNEEFLRQLEKQSGQQIRPSLQKKDTMSMSLDRSESVDRQTEYGDEYDEEGLDHQRQESLESGDGYPMSPPPQATIPEEDEMMMEEDLQERKDSLEEKEKGSKSVSFEEEPPKVERPERHTKGMSPREKWLWATNRICAQLAVSLSATFSFYFRHGFATKGI